MTMRAALVPVLVLLAACGAPVAGSIEVEAEPAALFPDDPGRLRIGALEYAGGLVLDSDHPGFGGWSALEVTPDGTRMLAISDNGAWMTASLAFDRDARLVAVNSARLAPMLGVDGAPLEAGSTEADAEGLAPLGGGDYAVSFERDHRVLRYALGEAWSAIETAVPEPWAAPPGVDRLRANAGLEALAPASASDSASGPASLWAAVEDPIVDGQPHTVWRLSEDDAQALSVRVEPGFGLTALARRPEGGLIAIQRFWSREIGNRIRILALDEDAFSENGPVDLAGGPELLAELSPDMTVDNIEGAAVAMIDGEARLFLISDDNFNDAQRTLLLSFRFVED